MSEKLGLMLAGATAAARALALVLQTCHWQAKGDPFYGDHKMFERLYEDVIPEIDELGERAIAFSDDPMVDIGSQFDGIGAFLGKLVGKQADVPSNKDLHELALRAEEMFLGWLKTSLDVLEKDGSLTPGVENMLGGIADTHETHVYLLQRALM